MTKKELFRIYGKEKGFNRWMVYCGHDLDKAGNKILYLRRYLNTSYLYNVEDAKKMIILLMYFKPSYDFEKRKVYQ